MEITRSIRRDRCGVVHVHGADLGDIYQGLGYAHARDRGMQMLFMRILGQGRVSGGLFSRNAAAR